MNDSEAPSPQSLAADPTRYERMSYRRCGRSGLKLPAISLGLWRGQGEDVPVEGARALLRRAFDLGITHFDLGNDYGPPPGAAEEALGRALRADLRPYRDELIISTKAGYAMWPGPYGEWGSRKYLLASLDASLCRLGLPYVDIFYSHRFDPDTPLEETMGALDTAVRQGKALYVGISSYPVPRTLEAVRILRELGTPLLIHQPEYSMLNRWIEDRLLDVLGEEGIGCIGFAPLAFGILSGKYLDGIPKGSRLERDPEYQEALKGSTVEQVKALRNVASDRGQTLAQMAIAWTLRDSRMASTLVGASRPEQLDENVAALQNLEFSVEELAKINSHTPGRGAEPSVSGESTAAS